MGSLCSRKGAEKEHSRHEKRNKSRKKKVSPANQKQISSLTSDIVLELKDLDKDFAQLEEANKKHKNNEHQVSGVLEHCEWCRSHGEFIHIVVLKSKFIF